MCTPYIGNGEHVELEVQLQHQRTVACDVAGKHVVLVALIEHVLAAIHRELIGVFNGNGRVRGTFAHDFVVEDVAAVSLLNVEFDFILGVGVRRPDGVEDVLAVVVYLHNISASFDGAGAVGRGVPAHEGIAGAGEGVFDGGNGRVVGDGVNRPFRFRAIVGLIGQGDGRRTRAPHAGEGHVVLDLILIAGLVDIVAVRPAEEVLSIVRNQLGRSHEVGKAVIRVLLEIRRSFYASDAAVLTRYNICNSEGAVLGVVGIEGDVAVNLGVNVEGFAGAIRAGAPAAPGITDLVLHDRFLKGIQLISDRAAICDTRKRRTIVGTSDCNIRCSVDSRLVPLRVDGDVLRGHGLAVEVVRLLRRRVRVPAAEAIIFLAGGLGRGRIASRVRNALFELLGYGVYRLAAADVDDVVAVAGVVEFGVVIVIFYLGAWRAIKSKAGNRVLIFLGYSIACARAGILMMQLIGDAANHCFAALARKHLYIVVGRFGAVAGLRAIEFSAVQRHCFNINLIWASRLTTACVRSPRTATIVCRPFVSDVRAIFSSNRETCNFLPLSILSFVELHTILIAIIIHIHDRRAVARDGLLRNGLRGEAGIALRRRAGLRAGSAGLGFGFLVGILIVIGVFQPMNDGVARIGIGRPDGVERQRLIELLPEGERRAAHGCRPVVERIAGAGGDGRRGGRAVALYERGRDIGAALRIVGDPVAVLNPGLEGYVAAVQRDGGYELAARVLPADDGLLIADGVGHALCGNRLAVRALLRDHDFALIIGEEHEVHVRELGVICSLRGLGHGDLAENGGVVIAVAPAGELPVRAAGVRRAGIVEGFAVLQDLAIKFRTAIHEDIGSGRYRRPHDTPQRDAGAGLGLRAARHRKDGVSQRVHRHAAGEHQHRQQQSEILAKLVFHRNSSSHEIQVKHRLLPLSGHRSRRAGKPRRAVNLY